MRGGPAVRTLAACVGWSVLALACGCGRGAASAKAPNEGGARFLSLNVGGIGETFHLEGERLSGPSTDITIDRDTHRGRLRGETLELGIAPGRVSGRYGAAPVDLRVVEEPAGTHAVGVVRDVRSQLDVTDDSIEGRFGSCAWQLHRARDARADGVATYAGYRTCGGAPPVPAELSLTTSFASRPAAERLVYITILFAA